MFSDLGIDFSPTVTAGSLLVILVMTAIVAWIKRKPDLTRAENESRVTAAAELAERYKAWRTEVHGLRNDLMVVAKAQRDCDKALAEAHSVNRHNEVQMRTMLFLIRLLIKELERLAPDSIIVAQAKVTLEQLGHEEHDPSKSTALAAAEETVKAAEIAVDEVKSAENGGDKE